jgi:hypothetical protein
MFIVGESLCHHAVILAYEIQNFQELDLFVASAIVFKTTIPQVGYAPYLNKQSNMQHLKHACL